MGGGRGEERVQGYGGDGDSGGAGAVVVVVVVRRVEIRTQI